ncbi:hypothetical protein VTK73DRAFT_531 [Phialemonium thermophilum]|uniref:Uncharacterized protein n=1 Tax=Phialemonium thermophilum TaxID=223376 RepID=A0ABR3Y5L2_9PEZI
MGNGNEPDGPVHPAFGGDQPVKQRGREIQPKLNMLGRETIRRPCSQKGGLLHKVGHVYGCRRALQVACFPYSCGSLVLFLVLDDIWRQCHEELFYKVFLDSGLSPRDINKAF